MACVISCIDLSLEGLTTGLNLDLEPGMTALFTLSGDQEVRTLTLALSGEQVPSQGSICFNGTSFAELTRNQLHQVRRSIGIVSASGGLISNLKLWENITLPLLFHGGTITDEARQAIYSHLERLELSSNLWTLPGHLSPSERRMVAFIRAAVNRPLCMIYAGCFDNLPSHERQMLLDNALRFHGDNPTVVSVFLTSATKALEQLEPDLHCNLRQNPALITRKQ